ncbi:nucleotidyltransferase domain-containing protein [Dankookia sp. GCM10030260]|uniref:nucleotidyltransferase domain-containing protein n=1 Tax=Dankookia sp. GCM10030260 TaxID=3273390 RepID=UPI00361B5A59
MDILHAGLFGSVARDEPRRGSDIDILVEFAPGNPRDIQGCGEVQERMAALFSGRVDVVDRGALLESREDIRLAQEFLGCLSIENLAADARIRSAVVRCREIVSEASRTVEPAALAGYPDAGNVRRDACKSVRHDLT